MISFNMMTTTELLEANKTLLAVRHMFCLQCRCHRAHGAKGGEQVRAWAQEHLQRLDEEIFALVSEFDNRELTTEDEVWERDTAFRESHDVLPREVDWEIEVVRRVAR